MHPINRLAITLPSNLFIFFTMNRITQLFLSFILALIAGTAFTQSKKFTPEDVVGMNPALYAKNLAQLQWMGQTDQYSWVDQNAVLVSTPQSKQNDTLLTLKQLNKAWTQLAADSLKRLPQINWMDAQKAYFFHKNTLYTLALPGPKITLITSLPEEAENIETATKSLKIAYTIENNLFLANGNEQTQLTQNPDGVVSGQTVHRNEFGIDKGIFWSDDETKIAYYRMDQRMVSDYPLVDISQRIASLKYEKYPMAGMKSHEVTIDVYDLNSKQTIVLETGEPAEQYLTTVTWSPDSKTIYTSLLNRDQNHLKLNAYDAATGKKTATLFEEKDEKYVEPQHPLYFINQHPSQFVWMSERDGFNHLYLYDTEGNLITQLTSGDWEVSNMLGFDPKGETVFFQATKESPLEQNTYALKLKNRQITRLSPENGIHRSMISHSGKYVIDSYTNATTSRVIGVYDAKGKNLKNLLTAENPLKDYSFGKTEIVKLRASDSTLLYGRIILPPGFDATKKYPVIIYVYGGPHAQMITNSMFYGSGFYLQYLSQKGYIVWTLDNRGSDKRGKKFEQAIHRQVGKTELEDQMTGVDYLLSLPYVDGSRIGVDGWSYGGFMAVNMKLSHPEIFKVATAGGPVIDWRYYEVMYGERYMDHPDDNPEGYNQSNLLNKVPQLDGKLMIIHGDMDPVVVWQNSLSFIKKCVDEGKLVDYFVYPGHEHNVRGKDRAHLIRKITSYFDENL